MFRLSSLSQKDSTIKHRIPGMAIGTIFEHPPPPIRVYLWTGWRQNFLKKRFLSHGFGFVTWMISFLFALGVKVNCFPSSGAFVTDLFTKPTDCQQFLEFSSAYPYHIKKSIVYSQGLWIRRVCSREVDFDRHMRAMHDWFLKRGYPKEFVSNQLNRVRHRPRAEVFERKERRACGVPLVVTFNPRLSGLSKLSHKHLEWLYAALRCLFLSGRVII